MSSSATCFNSDCVLMLHMNGADASTTFTDSSFTNTKTVTANGDAQIDTGQSKFGGASGLFDGNSDYLSIADSDDWNFGSARFTIDFWMRFNDTTGIQRMYNQSDAAGNEEVRIRWTTAALEFAAVTGGASVITISGAWSPSNGVWYHIAVVRGWSGNVDDFAVCVDGTAIATGTDSSVVPDVPGLLNIGRRLSDNDQFFNGWLDEYRVVKGTAVWTANFTPPSAEYFKCGGIDADIETYACCVS